MNTQLQKLLQEAHKRMESTPIEILEYQKNFSNSSGYFAGNSLGLMPENFPYRLQVEANIWKQKQHNGHYFVMDETDPNLKPWWQKQQQYTSFLGKIQ
jgi:kynureninase